MGRVKETYNIGGQRIKLLSLNWEVNRQYEIVPFFSYIQTQGDGAKDKLEQCYPGLFEAIYDELDDTHLIVPSGGIEKVYAPLDQGVNVFLSFAQLYNENQTAYPSTDKIIQWVSGHGLPFTSPSNARTCIFGDESTDSDFDKLMAKYYFFEHAIYVVFGIYVQFLGTLEILIEEANRLLLGANALRGNSVHETLISATQLAGYPEDILYLSDIDLNKVNDSRVEIRNILAQSLISRLAGYLNRLSPVFLAQMIPKTQRYGLFSTWRVPDLWTAMILQLAEFVSNNNELKICLGCGKLFTSSDPRVKHCPNTGQHVGTRSFCQGAHAQREHRNKPKKEAEKAAGTQSE